MPCVVVILTYNCAGIIGETVAQALKVSSWVYIVDSHSTDDTADIARRLGCEVVQRPFVNYSEQRNWAIEQMNGHATWQLHLDADEVLDDRAVQSICDVVQRSDPEATRFAYLLKRRDYFMGKMLRFSGLNPWHLRLFPSCLGQCEARLYDQHFLSPLPRRRLRGYMHDMNAQSLGEWVARHNKWSDLEAKHVLNHVGTGEGQLPARLSLDPRERTRLLKLLYYKLPSIPRLMAYFLYRYIIRGGFLDGRVGFYFAVMQGLWFRSLVDAKISESSLGKKRN
jgi:glycosyltransferase involved in cell wall biosynthesis